jgi:hypothetical protein
MNSSVRVANTAQKSRQEDAPVGWGAAIIDEQGNEVPITESMISRACDELARAWIVPRNQAMPA